MTVSVARLHAGDGYTYLTRQVASGDHPRDRGQDLADYYTAHGAPPGHWHGSAAQVLGVDGVVSESQMKALFGEGLHPNADVLIDAALQEGRSPEDAVYSARLGRKFATFDPSREQRWETALEEAREEVVGVGVGAGDLTREQRHEVRMVAAASLHQVEKGRPAATRAELEKFAVDASRPTRQPVAGFDLTFTPVKSVSVMWALSDDDTRLAIQDAHHAAVARAVRFIETDVAHTRSGTAGVAQVDAQGIIAAQFDHWDSRTGDPNLHTHLAISNRVQGLDGKWRTLDGRTLYAANVTISELYNASLESELSTRLGVEFVDRQLEQGKRPVREISHVDRRLVDLFSSRRRDIRQAYDQLLETYRQEHGHEPDRATGIRLAQEATLSTREAKGDAESLADKRDRWREAAVEVVGHDLAAVAGAQPGQAVDPRRPHPLLSEQGAFVGVDVAAKRVVDRVAEDRATWRAWHLKAETHRQVRGLGLSADGHQQLVGQVLDQAIATSVSCEAENDRPVPVELQRANGELIFRQHGAERFTSADVLAAERRVIDAARTPALSPVTSASVEAAVAAVEHESGFKLDDGQRRLVEAFATADRQVVVGIGPAGAGKTQAMRALVGAAEHAGTRVVLLAPSAAAAKALQSETGAGHADTVAKVLWNARELGPEHAGVNAGDVVLVDEAGMAATGDLDRLNALCEERGAVMRLLGDDQQLAAVGAGGLLRTIAHEVGAVRLEDLHRFSDPAEAAATLQLRDGDTAALGFYSDADRITQGTRDQQVAAVFSRWVEDTRDGKSSIMVAGDRATVRDLNDMARALRAELGDVDEAGVPARGGVVVSVGDTIVTRRNDRRISMSDTDYVKNGDLWAVTGAADDGSLTVKHTRSGKTVDLPADYVRDAVELGYATTITRAQGMTVDTGHVLVDDTLSRAQLYVAMTRGRHVNAAHVVVDVDQEHQHQVAAQNATEVLATVMGRVNPDEVSAHQIRSSAAEDAHRLSALEPQLQHAQLILHEQRIEQALDRVLGADGHEDLQDDPAYSALKQRLADVAGAGEDPEAALRAAYEARELAGARSAAQVLHWRLDRLAPTEQRATSSGSPQMQRWLEQQRSLIEARKIEVGDAAVATTPKWVRAARAGGREVPDEVVRNVAIYRDQHDVTDSLSPLGAEPPTGSDSHARWTELRSELEEGAAAQVAELDLTRGFDARRPSPRLDGPDLAGPAPSREAPDVER